jgi:glycosyltransferase involved in cell wall biosynthesis
MRRDGGEAPTVSVLIAAWNAERFIGDALDSALSQTRPPAEVIVVDDGSTDGTASVAGSYGPPVIVRMAPHRGISATRNDAMAQARGDLLAFLDADDRWRPTKLERQVARLVAEPRLEAVFGLVDEFVDEGGHERRRSPGARRSGPLPSSLLIRAEAARRVGPFDLDVSAGDWIDWWSRALDAGVTHGSVDEVVVDRRIHAANNSGRATETSAEYLRAVRARLRRSRTAP